MVGEEEVPTVGINKKMKILNLYAGIGGNRRLWGNKHEITAVEHKQDIADVYHDMFPKDTVIVGDAHQYLLDHYKEFDFIWTSPPCPTHSQYRYNVGVLGKGFDAVYPDMTLYQEILLLQYYFKKDFVVENTVSYYDPLIAPQKLSRHYIWSNRTFTDIKIKPVGLRDKNKIEDIAKASGYDLSKYPALKNKRQVVRNCVSGELGLHLLKQIV